MMQEYCELRQYKIWDVAYDYLHYMIILLLKFKMQIKEAKGFMYILYMSMTVVPIVLWNLTKNTVSNKGSYIDVDAQLSWRGQGAHKAWLQTLPDEISRNRHKINQIPNVQFDKLRPVPIASHT